MADDRAHASTSGTLLIATRNPGKLAELASLLADVPFRLMSLDEAGIDTDVAETGATLEDNARLKATQYAAASGMLTLADDSGLEVDALNGEPGPLSARYAGPDASDAQRIAFLLRRLADSGERDRSARFRCVIAVARPGEPAATYTGECRGRIISRPRGRGGFGYDPVFLIPELGKTMAELSSEEKNLISHRSAAARKATDALSNVAT